MLNKGGDSVHICLLPELSWGKNLEKAGNTEKQVSWAYYRKKNNVGSGLSPSHV